MGEGRGKAPGPPGTVWVYLLGGSQGSVDLLPAGQDGLLDEGEDEEDAGAFAPLPLGEVVGDDVVCGEKGQNNQDPKPRSPRMGWVVSGRPLKLLLTP